MLFFRPIIHWTAANVFSFAEAHGMRHNPLYTQGMGRVGCFPCINENKAGLKQINARFPEAFEKLTEWEAMVADASKRGVATFFAPDVTPEGADLVRQLKFRTEAILRRDYPADIAGKDRKRAVSAIKNSLSAAMPWPNARAVSEWAQTGRGGRQFDMLDLAFADDGVSCSSQYGLCE
jgi:hypothetical protein